MTRKRKEGGLPCGNPLYLQWLGEWMQTASEKNNKAYYVYKKAYESMSKYPLPFQHASEAAILHGIGPSICKKLEQRHKEHCLTNDLPLPQRSEILPKGTELSAPVVADESSEPSVEPSVEPPRKRQKRMYVPQYRSGAYAIMLALFIAYGNGPGNQDLTKAEIIREGQQFCDSSFETPIGKARSYTAWNAMTTLIEKDYVYKHSWPARFTLTDAGLAVAHQLADAARIHRGSDDTKLTDMMHTGKPSALHPKKQRSAVVTIPDLFQNAIAAAQSKKESSKRATEKAPSPVKVINLVDDKDELRHTSASSLQTAAAGISSVMTARSADDPCSEPVTLGQRVDTSSTLPTFTPQIWKAGSFEIVLVLDNREVRHKTDRDYIASKLTEKGVCVSTRNIELGDVIWVARSKKVTSENEDIVLDYVLERKRMDDLICSIKDGRFREQKFRLTRSGVGQVIYLLEEYGLEDSSDKWFKAIETATSSTQMVDGFFLKRTKSLDQTINYLVSMTRMLKSLHENSDLHIIPNGAVFSMTYLSLRQHLAATEPDRTYFITYASYSALNAKTRPCTLRDTFAKILMTVRGISADKASEVIRQYPTPRRLFRAYTELDSDDKRQAMLQSGPSTLGRRRIGPSLSDKMRCIWYADTYS